MRSNVGIVRHAINAESLPAQDSDVHPAATFHAAERTNANRADLTSPPKRSHASSFSHDANELDFSELDLACPIDAEAISNRWLNTYVPVPGQAVKNYPPRVIVFINRSLKAYASSVVHNRNLPAFIHPAQHTIISQSDHHHSPLSTCLSLVAILRKPPQIDHKVAANIFTQQMAKLADHLHTFEPLELLEAFQSYLLYILVSYFNFLEGPNSFLREAMVTLQGTASSACESGIMCAAELQDRHTRPKWEAWIVAESTRRTMYVMTLLDSLLATQDGITTFLATELRGLPAPQSKELWQAQTRWDFETKYNAHLVEWPDGPLTIDELWPVPFHLDEDAVVERQRRVNQWLEGVDEFGMMLYAITCCTHET